MGMISDFVLPSDPTKLVRLREATVQDAIDFSDIDSGHEEAVTSLFLEKMQDSSTYSDPKLWTGDDRRFALYWYFIHTTKDLDVPVVFKCPYCGEKHTALCSMQRLYSDFKPIEGRAFREIEHGETAYIVRHLNGLALEELEAMTIEHETAVEEFGDQSGKAKKLESQIKFKRFLFSLEEKKQFAIGEERDEKSERIALERKLLSMRQVEFSELAEKVSVALDEMEHGLPSAYEDGRIYLLVDMQCTNKKEGSEQQNVRIRLPFRSFDYIPKI